MILAGTTLTNQSGGLYDLQSDSGIVTGGGGVGYLPTFTNAGTLRKLSGIGTSSISLAFDNSGTLEVDSGTVRLPPAQTRQIASGTLTGGTWTVSAGATLSTDAITTNQGTVTLDGPGASFPGINGLTTNGGTLQILGSATFTTSGNLANSGILRVGSGSTLTAAGGYNLGSGGTVGIEVGGPPSSGLYGQLNTSGPATLGGTLNVTLASGFSPTFGQSFPILHFASGNATFATINLPSSNGTPLFTASLTATTLTLMRPFNLYLPLVVNQTVPR